jgi:hypothetical protein
MKENIASAKETIRLSKNLFELLDDNMSDYDEIKDEIISNLEWANKDLQKVREFLYPEKYATMH